MALTLLRHSALPKKYHNCYNGWTDIPIDLALFEHTHTIALKTQPFDLVYTSDLQRCTQTLAQLGIHDYISDTRLREVQFKNEIEGKSFKKIEALPSFKTTYLQDEKRWHSYICAESVEAFEMRIDSFLEDLPSDKEILICSHAGTLKTIMKRLKHTQIKLKYLQYIRINNVI